MSRVVVTDHAFSGVARERAAAQSAGAAFSEHQCRSEAETLEAVEGANVVFNNFAPMNARTMGVMAKGAAHASLLSRISGRTDSGAQS